MEIRVCPKETPPAMPHTARWMTILTLLAGAGPAHAEFFYQFGHTGEILPESELPKPTPEQVAAAPKFNPRGATGIDFTITYLDSGTGIGFDDAALGASRKAVFEAVLNYVDGVLRYPGGDLAIRVNASETDGSGSLARGGTSFQSGANGFLPGTSFLRLDTGNDVNGANPEISITVDFGYNWNNTLGPPAIGQFDLFSVLLHEFTHGLGVTSFASSSTGVSVFAPTLAYSRWDAQLFQNVPDAKVWNQGTFVFQASTLVGGLNAVSFRGTNATRIFPGEGSPPVHTPDSFAGGSSIAHWQQNSPIPSGTVMRPFSIAGFTTRSYQPFEVGALVDLGYRVRSEEWVLF